LKRTILTAIAVLAVNMFIYLPAVRADLVKAPAIGSTFQMYISAGGGGFNGGGFDLYSPPGTFLFQTFCLTENEYFYPGHNYTVTGYESGLGPSGLSPAAAALYYHFRLGDLPGYNNATDQTALQQAFWYLEKLNDTDSVAANGNPNAANNKWVGIAQGYGWTGTGPVVSIEFDSDYPYQGAPGQDVYGIVPEPGILILLGIAMSAVGMAYPFVRKI